jgi:glycosyltransferase involved in cell wall biosynthesis
MQDPKVAVLIPCYNEAPTIADLVSKVKQAMPAASIYVYDNNSTDATAQLAKDAGAIVRHEPRRGKGNVVRRMFADIDADIYAMMDGDLTYDIDKLPEMVAQLQAEQLDMLVGRRITTDRNAYRAGHVWGNKALTTALRLIFGQQFQDILSGYRVFSRRFVKSFPTFANGFEIETEMSIYALQLGMPVAEIDTNYYARPEGSFSKLDTYSDGFRILWTILNLFRIEKPFVFFGIFALAQALLSVMLFYPIWQDYQRTGLVEQYPTATLCMGLMLASFLSFFTGLILDNISRLSKDMRRLNYLQIS